ncbi:MAG: hypothetical protein FJ121_00605 [Deltaproteobacteria bacterium]|nr:hypothetical protein [Deltaproteobacteria bacterium]
MADAMGSRKPQSSNNIFISVLSFAAFAKDFVKATTAESRSGCPLDKRRFAILDLERFAFQITMQKSQKPQGTHAQKNALKLPQASNFHRHIALGSQFPSIIASIIRKARIMRMAGNAALHFSCHSERSEESRIFR